jgi:hypothetical protein
MPWKWTRVDFATHWRSPYAGRFRQRLAYAGMDHGLLRLAAPTQRQRSANAAPTQRHGLHCSSYRDPALRRQGSQNVRASAMADFGMASAACHTQKGGRGSGGRGRHGPSCGQILNECNRLWLLKNSLARNPQKKDRVRMPYKQLSLLACTFSIPKISPDF